MTTRTVISKSTKKKMPSEIKFEINVDGKNVSKKVIRAKAGTYTEQVVFREKLKDGRSTSVTKHEIRK